MAVLGARGGPQAERAIDMHPGAVATRDRDQIGKGIERPNVEIARLQQHDGGLSPAAFQDAFERARFELTQVVARQ